MGKKKLVFGKKREKRIISFDFDYTLCLHGYDEYGAPDYTINKLNQELEKILHKYVNLGDEVIIVSTRAITPYNMTSIKNFVKEHNLPIKHIYLTDGKNKAQTLKDLNVNIHYDDDKWELSTLGIQHLGTEHIKGIQV